MFRRDFLKSVVGAVAGLFGVKTAQAKSKEELLAEVAAEYCRGLQRYLGIQGGTWWKAPGPRPVIPGASYAEGLRNGWKFWRILTLPDENGARTVIWDPGMPYPVVYGSFGPTVNEEDLQMWVKATNLKISQKFDQHFLPNGEFRS